MSIMKATLEHWTAVEAVLAYHTEPTTVPKGVVPDPPDYTNCIAYLASLESEVDSQQKPTTDQLKSRCRQRHRLLQDQMLELLIKNDWLAGESAARGLTVSDAEVNRAIRQQFPNEAAFHKLLRYAGEKAADIRAELRGDLMATKLQQAVVAKQGLSTAQQQQLLARFLDEFTKRWTARTDCRPGFVVQKCRQYKGPKSSTEV